MKNIRLIPLFILITLLLSRMFLYFFPNVNISFSSYSIHHLYVGVFILLLLLPFLLIKKLTLPLSIFLGISLGLILDEFFFLVFTKGTDADYTTSLFGMILFTIIYLIYFYFVSKK